MFKFPFLLTLAIYKQGHKNCFCFLATQPATTKVAELILQKVAAPINYLEELFEDICHERKI